MRPESKFADVHGESTRSLPDIVSVCPNRLSYLHQSLSGANDIAFEKVNVVRESHR